MHGSNVRRTLTLLLWLTFCVSGAGLAQFIPTGMVAGTVKDPNGAVVPNATITLTNTQTGVVFGSTKSSQTGQFLFPNVPPGMYKTETTGEGFQTSVHDQVPVEVGNTTTVDITLQLGSIKQTITVSAAAPILNTVSSSVGTTITSQLMEELPLAGQTPLNLMYLSPGILFAVGAEIGGGMSWYFAGSPNNPQGLGIYNVSYVAANGGNDYTNNFQMDNAGNNRVERISFNPVTDQLEEFQVLPNSYDAQHQNGGMSIIAVTKSGTNDFHGDLFEFGQSNIFNANTFFNNLYGAPRPTDHYNEFGGSVGGPIRIPHVINGKDKLFFFFNFDDVREPSKGTVYMTLPTDAQRAGDFSQSRDANGNPIQIYNPYTTRPDLNNPGQYIRDQFPGNVIPSTMINPTAKTLMGMLPEPNRTGEQYTNVNNWSTVAGSDIPQNLYSGRIDYNIDPTNRIYGRFSEEMERALPEHTIHLGEGTEMDYGSQNVVLGWTSTFTPKTVLEVALGYARHLNDFKDDLFDLAAVGFAPNLASQTHYLPYMTISSFSPIGNALGQPYFVHADDETLNINLRRMQGRHSLKGGFQATVTHFNNGAYQDATGFTFDNLFTQGPNPTTVGSNIGYGLAGFLLGLDSPTDEDSVGGPLAVVPASRSYGAYVHDDFRVNSKLTLNLGVRWDAWQVAAERYNRQTVGFAFGVANPLQAQAQANYAANDSMMFSILPPSQFKVPGGLLFATPQHQRWANTIWDNFCPRIGFAYRVQSKTVLRGGFGIFKTLWYGGLDDNTGFVIYQPILASLDGITPNPTPTTFNNPMPNGQVSPPGSSLGLLSALGTGIGPNDQSTKPYSYARWSLGFQRELTPTTIAEINYVGSTTFHLPFEGQGQPPFGYSTPATSSHSHQLDYVLPQYISLGSQLFNSVPNPFYGVDTADTAGTYLASPTISEGQLLMTYPEFSSFTQAFESGGKSYYHSLQITVTRRMSQGLTLLSSYTFSKTLDRYTFLNPSDAAPVKEVGQFDSPQKFALGGVYQLPFGPGRKFGWKSGPLGKLIEGWQYGVNGIIQSGTPMAMSAPVVATGADPTLSDHTYLHWFNGAAFVPQPELSLRTSPWFYPGLRYDDINNWDMSLIKSTKLTEKTSLQIRWEVFNAPNRFMVGTPDTNPLDPTYTQALSQANFPRYMQFGLKLIF